jgi:hypothetical protein
MRRLDSIDGMVGITRRGGYDGKIVGGEFTKVYKHKQSPALSRAIPFPSRRPARGFLIYVPGFSIKKKNVRLVTVKPTAASYNHHEDF